MSFFDSSIVLGLGLGHSYDSTKLALSWARIYKKFSLTCLRSVAQSCLTLRPHGLQHARLPCPSSAPRSCLNSCSSSQWCHPTISSSTVLFSFCLQSFLASESFPMSRLFTSGGQNVGVSASAETEVSPSNEYSRLISFRMDWLDLLADQGTLKSLLQHHNSKASILWHSLSS